MRYLKTDSSIVGPPNTASKDTSKETERISDNQQPKSNKNDNKKDINNEEGSNDDFKPAEESYLLVNAKLLYYV